MAKILVVDDDPSIVALIRETLEGHEVISSDNGSDGIVMARQVMPDLIVMDVTMPRLSGTVACARIKADPALAHIPVVLLTGWGKISDVEEGFSAKADEYIVKPFSPRVFKARLEQLLGLKPVDGIIAD